MKKKVIVVTDGDKVAQEAVECAAKNLGLRTISSSAGNPTPLSGKEIAELALSSSAEVVVVMCDDRGKSTRGKGEEAIYSLAKDQRLQIIGALAVASHTPCEGVKVDRSITKTGELVSQSVDKDGESQDSARLYGDTVDALGKLGISPIIGLGDPGKMDRKDEAKRGAPITTQALLEILQATGENLPSQGRNWQETGEVELKGLEGERE